MSFDATEKSTESASPRELFEFYQGPLRWDFTGADAAFTYNGRLYARVAGARSSADFSQEDNAGGIRIELPADNAVVQRYVGFQPTAPLYVIVRRVHRDHSAAQMFTGRVARVTFDGLAAQLACVPAAGDFHRRVPALIYQSQCNWALYGPGCLVDATAFRTVAVVSQVEGFLLHAAAFAAKPDGWFAAGWVELVTGERAGDRRYVTVHTGEILTLSAPFAAAVDGDTVHAYAGCDRTEATCAAKFGNLARFSGFARIPNLNPHTGRMA